MAEGRPDQEEVSGPFVEPGRHRVPERVGGDRPDRRLPGPCREPSASVASPDPPPPVPDEEGAGRAGASVAPELTRERTTQEDEVLAATLHVAESHLTPLQVEVLDVEGDRRPQPDARLPHQAEENAVAARSAPSTVTQGPREAPVLLRR